MTEKRKSEMKSANGGQMQRLVINAVSLFVCLPFWFLCIGTATLMAGSNARENKLKAAWREMIDYPQRVWRKICKTW